MSRRTGIHPFFGMEIDLPDEGRYRYLGGNIGCVAPISVSVIDSCGEDHEFDLAELLEHIDDFWNDNFRSVRSRRDSIIECLFLAYESTMMTDEERNLFEAFARHYIASNISPIDAVKAVFRAAGNRRVSHGMKALPQSMGAES